MYSIYLAHRLTDSALAPNFKEVIQNVEAIQHIFKEANDELDAAFEPEAPDSVYRADSFISANQRPIRVLSLGTNSWVVFMKVDWLTGTFQMVEVFVVFLLSISSKRL